MNKEVISKRNNFLIGDHSKISNILVVEDDSTYEAVWTAIIERADKNTEFSWATSELEAEQMIYASLENGHPFDLIITDIFLSGSKTGIDLWSKFKNLFRGRIIVTSSVEYKKFNQYFGKEDIRPVFIQKPLIPHDCIEMIYSMLHQK